MHIQSSYSGAKKIKSLQVNREEMLFEANSNPDGINLIQRKFGNKTKNQNQSKEKGKLYSYQIIYIFIYLYTHTYILYMERLMYKYVYIKT